MKVTYFGYEKPTKEKFNLPRQWTDRPHIGKPYGGLWTCPAESDYRWKQWCESEMPDWVEGREEYTLTVKPGAVFLTIDSLDDLKNVVAEFSLPGLRDPIYDFIAVPLDWERIAEVCDGIWLTEKGQWETRLSDPNLYGWDLECILFLNWAFEEEE